MDPKTQIQNPNQPVINQSESVSQTTVTNQSTVPVVGIDQPASIQATPAQTSTRGVNPVDPENSNTVLPKSVHRAGVWTLVLGILLTAVGALLGLFVNYSFLFNVILGLILMYEGYKLIKTHNAKVALTALKIVSITVIVDVIASLLTGGAVGIFTLIVIIFVLKANIDLNKAGLTTSRALITAKPKFIK